MTGLKNGWLVKKYYVKRITELLLNVRVAFSPLKNSIWRTRCCCLCTGTAILFHFERMIEVTLDSFLNWKWCLNRTLTSVGFKEAILAAVHFRNWIYLSPVQFWIKLHLLTALRIDLVVSLKFYLPSILCRGQGMQKGVISWLQVSNLLMYYFITDHHALSGCYVALCWSCFCTFNTQVCRRGLLLFYKLTSALIAGRECYLMFK